MSELLINIDWYEIWQATLDTLLMLGGSLLFTVILGLPVGVLLFLVGPRQMFEHRALYAMLSFVVNVLRPEHRWAWLGQFRRWSWAPLRFLRASWKLLYAKWTAASLKPRKPWAPVRGRLFSMPYCLKHAQALLLQLR